MVFSTCPPLPPILQQLRRGVVSTKVLCWFGTSPESGFVNALTSGSPVNQRLTSLAAYSSSIDEIVNERHKCFRGVGRRAAPRRPSHPVCTERGSREMIVRIVLLMTFLLSSISYKSTCDKEIVRPRKRTSLVEGVIAPRRVGGTSLPDTTHQRLTAIT